MALTRDFKETVLARVQADPAFRDALLKEGIEALLAGDMDGGRIILRDHIKATVSPPAGRSSAWPPGWHQV